MGKVWIIISVVVLVLGGVALSVYTYKIYQKRSKTTDAQTKPVGSDIVSDSTDTNTKTPVKTIGIEAIQLVDKKSGYCKALAPNDWAFISNAQATGADLFAPGKVMHAGWGISGVPSYLYPTVESFLNTWMPLAGFTGFTMGESKDLGEGFIERDFSSNIGKKGVMIYKVYNFGASDYVVSVYMADTDESRWEADGAKAIYSAISIRCVSQLRPTTTSVDVSSSNPSSSSDNPEVSLSDKWTEAIMGFENVYSPTTGDHYEASTSSYWDTGPEGGGYYRDLPNGGYEKLNRGFGDY